MIITLADAQAIDPNITQDRLDAYEAAIRQLTNNRFQIVTVRSVGFTAAGATLTFDPPHPPNLAEMEATWLPDGVEVGDTVQIGATVVNDGLYVIESLTDDSITLNRPVRKDGHYGRGLVTLVVYPADIKEGVRRLIKYDKTMMAKMGIKSESISRMSLQYYDVNARETVNGYPANLMSFIRKYTKIKWGG